MGSTADKIKGAGNEAVGKAKQGIGEAVGSDKLQGEGAIQEIKGKARMRWGAHLQFTAEAGPGDFIFIPPYVPHQEINASRDEILECVLVRSDGQAVAINLDIEPVEKPETVLWVDPVHRDPAETK